VSGDDWGIIITGVGSVVATVCGFVLAFRRDTFTRRDSIDVNERVELNDRRRWYRLVTREVIVPLRDYFAERGESEPVDFDRWTKYPPKDDE
jgi:hypothetical protein